MSKLAKISAKESDGAQAGERLALIDRLRSKLSAQEQPDGKQSAVKSVQQEAAMQRTVQKAAETGRGLFAPRDPSKREVRIKRASVRKLRFLSRLLNLLALLLSYAACVIGAYNYGYMKRFEDMDGLMSVEAETYILMAAPFLIGAAVCLLCAAVLRGIAKRGLR